MIEKRSTEYLRVTNSVAAPPVALFRYHHSDTLSNVGTALRHANCLLQTDPDSTDLKAAKTKAVENLLAAKKTSDEYMTNVIYRNTFLLKLNHRICMIAMCT